MTASYKDIVIESPTSAFGEVLVAEQTPEVQLDASTGLRTQQEVETYVGTTGSVTVEDTGTGYEWRCQTGTDVGGYGLVRSQNALVYKAGQGSALRFTARFDKGIALSTLRAGGIGVGNELSFGYNGTSFGILFRRAGKLEMRRLTLSAAATGNETATITLNGTEYTVSLTNGTTVHNTNEIAAATYGGAWVATGNDSTILFIAQSVGAKSGTYSFSSTGTAAGTFSQVAAGAAVNDTWYPQSTWNVNRCNGSGPFAMTLNPQNINVYEIKYQYLGAGNLDFSIENPADGRFALVHRIQYAGNFQSPSITNPSYKVGVFAASLGSTTNLSAYSSSMAAFLQGREVETKNPDGHSNSRTGVGTTLTNILSIRVRQEINGIIQLKEVLPHLLTYAGEGTKPIAFECLLNPTLAGDPDWQYHEGNTTNTIVEIMDTSVTVSHNDGVTQEVANPQIGKSGNGAINLEALGVRLKRGDVLTIAGKATSGTADISASIIWKEK